MRKFLLLITVVGVFAHGYACDACNLYEYTSLKNRSYAAFFFGSRLFNGYNQLGHQPQYTLTPRATFQEKRNHLPNVIINPSEKDYELYSTYEVRVNLNLMDKYNLMLIVPYRQATVYFDEVYPDVGPRTSREISLGGIGDMILGLERLHNFVGEMTHRFKYGVGFKMPTGEHEKRDVHNYMFDPMLQPGTGSWDFILRGTYVGIYKQKIGCSMFVNGRLNTKSTIKPDPREAENSQYKFGNRLNLNLNLFYVWKTGDLQVVPKTGTYIESSGYDRLYEADSQQTVEGTGGKTVFINTGLDLNFKAVTLQTLWQWPVYEDLNDSQISNAGRMMLGVIYNFDI